MERTELEQIIRAGIEVTLGGRVYTFRPLTFGPAQEWQKQVTGLMRHGADLYSKRGAGDIDAAADMIEFMTHGQQEAKFEALRAWDNTKPWEVIRNEAYPDEIEAAFEALVKLANPTLAAMMKKIGAATTEKGE